MNSKPSTRKPIESSIPQRLRGDASQGKAMHMTMSTAPNSTARRNSRGTVTPESVRHASDIIRPILLQTLLLLVLVLGLLVPVSR